MPSQYIVIKFGNVITGEYLNIGVATFEILTEQPIYFKFITKWDRICKTFGADITGDIFLNSIVADISTFQTKQELFDYIRGSSSPYCSLQFTETRASLEPAEQLLDWAFKTFIVE